MVFNTFLKNNSKVRATWKVIIADLYFLNLSTITLLFLTFHMPCFSLFCRWFSSFLPSGDMYLFIYEKSSTIKKFFSNWKERFLWCLLQRQVLSIYLIFRWCTNMFKQNIWERSVCEMMCNVQHAQENYLMWMP